MKRSANAVSLLVYLALTTFLLAQPIAGIDTNPVVAEFTATNFPVDELAGGAITNDSPSVEAGTEMPDQQSRTNDTNSVKSTEQPPPARRPNDSVTVGGATRVPAGETVLDAVTVFGKAEVDGEVKGDMVTVFGPATLTGKVHHDMVIVFGDAEIDGEVGHDLVSVFGTLKLGPNAKVGGDCMAVFSALERDPGAVLAREPVLILPAFSGVGTYLRQGPMLGRLIPPTSVVAWVVVAVHLVLYFFVVLLLPKQVAACGDLVRTKPWQSFGLGLLVAILLIPLSLLLAATGIGAVLVPVLGAAKGVLMYFGKAALILFFGMQLLRQPSGGSGNRMPASFLTGFALLTVLYMVPVVGLLVWLILRPLSLGAPLLMLLENRRQNGNGGPASPPIPVQTVNPPGSSAAAIAPPDPTVQGASMAAGTVPASEVQLMQRAGFWVRTGATALDLVLLVGLAAFVDEFFLLVWLGYHIAMWSWRGTTIGGIICNLAVVREDGRPAGLSAAVVRGLASVFSGLALGLGFFWVGWTPERQSWHDKIAGTVIVRVPRSVSLV